MHLESVRIFPEKFPVRDRYPFNIRILQDSPQLVFRKSVSFFVGENGTGKSTLLKSICRSCGIHIWDSERGTRFKHNPFEDRLDSALEIHWEQDPVPGTCFDSRIFESFARLLDEWAHDDPGQLDYFGGKSLMEQSHGQSLMSFFRARYRLRGLYFLDEPECALSPNTQLEFLDLLAEYGGNGNAQFIIATHSPILMSLPGACIYGFDGERIEEVEFRNTGHYAAYKRFFERE